MSRLAWMAGPVIHEWRAPDGSTASDGLSGLGGLETLSYQRGTFSRSLPQIPQKTPRNLSAQFKYDCTEPQELVFRQSVSIGEPPARPYQ